MDNPATDKVFAGSIPKLYETHLVPLIFEHYAEDLARRLASRARAHVLEVAAGAPANARSGALDTGPWVGISSAG